MKEIMDGIEGQELTDLYLRFDQKAYQAGFDRGMELIEFSSADGKRLVNLAREIILEETIKKAPEYGSQLRKLLAKY